MPAVDGGRRIGACDNAANRLGDERPLKRLGRNLARLVLSKYE